ncbi:MAG: hypothetical protein WAO02_14810 [Verrucomicrobiia bacterium]
MNPDVQISFNDNRRPEPSVDFLYPPEAEEQREAELIQIIQDTRLKTLRAIAGLITNGRKDGLCTRVAALEVICGKPIAEAAAEIGKDRTTVARAVESLKALIAQADGGKHQ